MVIAPETLNKVRGTLSGSVVDTGSLGFCKGLLYSMVVTGFLHQQLSRLLPLGAEPKRLWLPGFRPAASALNLCAISCLIGVVLVLVLFFD